jgi:uncharacterized repeat protein (TIGR03803 family)
MSQVTGEIATGVSRGAESYTAGKLRSRREFWRTSELLRAPQHGESLFLNPSFRKESFMTNTEHHGNRISRMRQAAASAALAIAAMPILAIIILIITAPSAHAQTFTTMVNFNGTNGANPFNMSLIQGPDGNLYGTTFVGGANNLGTIFMVNPTSTGVQTPTTLYSFAGSSANPPDGANPAAGLVLASNGVFYGTTSAGGANGGGTVFSMIPPTSPGGTATVTILYSFCQVQETSGYCADGNNPQAPLMQASDGNLYGTTVSGGNACIVIECGGGTIFSVTPGGAVNVALASFGSGGGEGPAAALVQDSNGIFYGTTLTAGNNPGGTVFEFSLGGEAPPLYYLGGTPGPLIQASNGYFYVTVAGKLPNNGGTGSTLLGFTTVPPTPPSAVTTVYTFCSNTSLNPGEPGVICLDGADPYSGVIQASDGNLYGTTSLGGTNLGGNENNSLCLLEAELLDGCGTIFEIPPVTGGTTGTLTTLHNFGGTDGFNGTNGTFPLPAYGGNGLVQATNGVLYGATVSGGATDTGVGTGDGTVFSLNVGAPPFVQPLPAAAQVGMAVIILGTNLTDATGVSFNGTPAAFTVVSSSEITTSVPAGATNGLVTVTFANATALTSNQPFVVAPGGVVTAPAASLGPTGLTFASQAVGTTSAAQTITLTNTGNAALSITGITITGTNPGDFAASSCPNSLAAAGTCVINVTFTPGASGTRTAILNVSDNASGSPQTASLTGTGTSPAASLSPIGLSFASQAVGTTSAAQTITLTNTGNAALSITGITITGSNPGDFAASSCPSSLAAAGTCVISVTFTPGASGTRTATLNVTDNASGSPQTVSLTGTGTASAPTLQSITIVPANPTVVTGATLPFAATGNYSDGSTQNLTATATWVSSATSVATMSGAIATALHPGTTTIRATVGATSGTTTLIVEAPSVSITAVLSSITPVGAEYNVSISVTNTGNITATTINGIGLLGLALDVTSIPANGVAPGATATVTLTFPASAGRAGVARDLTVLLASTGTAPRGNIVLGDALVGPTSVTLP